MYKPGQKQPGFTIVELLIVIVIIGILAAITVVAYNGITKKAVITSLQSDLGSASKNLKLYQVENDAYPTALDCSVTPATNTICLKASPGTSYAYSANNNANPQVFALRATNGNLTYALTNNAASAQVAAVTCPPGFIVVPGSATYGTSDFCTMKYVASQVGATTTPISQAGTTPWVYISQTNALANSPNVAGCTGCHLMTEPEYLTIAQNVLSVASNWSGGTVGSGYIYSGHNDNDPANALVADSNDANGYAGETNTGGNQRRTLSLTNGEVIWDLAGNVWQWTAGTVTTGQPGITGETGYAWKEWSNVTAVGTLSPSASPAETGLAGASSWNSIKGAGQLYSYVGQTAVRGFLRGGSWYSYSHAGVLAMYLLYAPSTTNTAFGFRVSR